MPGDEGKSCNSLYAEMSQLDTEVMQKRKEITNRDTWNIVVICRGIFYNSPMVLYGC